MGDTLRDPILYPNWVWLTGTGLLLLALITGLSMFLAYRFSQVRESVALHSLSQVRRERYLRLLGEVYQDAADGRLTARQAHLAMSSLIRAAASERLKTNVESLTVGESAQMADRWPALVEALRWCETPSFGVGELKGVSAVAVVQGGLERARVVIEQ